MTIVKERGTNCFSCVQEYFRYINRNLPDIVQKRSPTIDDMIRTRDKRSFVTAKIQHKVNYFNWFRRASQSCFHTRHIRTCQHRPLRNAATTHPVWCTDPRKRFGQSVSKTALFCCIVHAASGLTINGANIDDDASFIVHHMFYNRTCKQHRCSKVHLNAPVQYFNRFMDKISVFQIS